jgi:outer membrane protein assembly factor BamB
MEIKWQIEPSEIPDKRLTRLTLSGDRLYATGERLYAISAQGGSIIWSSEKTGLLEHPRSFNSYLVVRTRYQDLFVIDSRSGQIIGHMLVRANGSSLYGPGRSPIIAGNLIIVPFGDNRVFAYRLK